MQDHASLQDASSRHLPDRIGESTGVSARDTLRDFSTDRRILLLVAMALVVGTAGAVAAWALLHLIYFATNIA